MKSIGLAVAGVLLGSAHATAQPAVIEQRAVQLEETETTFLGQPIHLTAVEGGYLVTDGQQPQVLRYDRDGRLVQVYGREGEGPGELLEAEMAVPHGPDRIAVVSWNPNVIQLFGRETGAYVDRVTLETRVEALDMRGDTIWIGMPQVGRGAAGLRLVQGSGDRLPLGDLPRLYAEGGPVFGIFPDVVMARWADTTLVGFEPTGEIQVIDATGSTVESFVIPSERRRRTPADLERALREAMGRAYPEVFGVPSALKAIHRRTDGSFIVVFFDYRAEPPPVSSEVFVSVLAPNRNRVCLDARLPLPDDAHPVLGFDGDRLLVLNQEIDPEAMDVTAILRTYEVDTSRCAWRTVADRPKDSS